MLGNLNNEMFLSGFCIFALLLVMTVEVETSALPTAAVKVAELESALAWKTEEVARLKETSEIMHNKVIQIRGEILIMIGYKKVDDFYLM